MFKKNSLSLLLTVFAVAITARGVSAQDVYDRVDPAREEQPVAASFLFDKDISYDVYYEVTAYEIHRIENVRIQEIIDINNEPFMVVQFSGMTSRVGYIHLASVRAILPTGAPRPNRSAELRKY